jgi:hypothetical protein
MHPRQTILGGDILAIHQLPLFQLKINSQGFLLVLMDARIYKNIFLCVGQLELTCFGNSGSFNFILPPVF